MTEIHSELPNDLPIKEIPLSRNMIPQLQEIFDKKFHKGDIQAELYLHDLTQGEGFKIRVNLKQLFIIIQALIQIHPSRLVSIKEIRPDAITEVLTRKLFICLEGNPIRDISDQGVTAEDLAIRTQAETINHAWKKI